MLQLRAALSPHQVDFASGLLASIGILTVLFQEPGDMGTDTDPVDEGKVRLVVFTDDPETASHAGDVLQRGTGATPEIRPFTDHDWFEIFRAHHRTVRVADTLAVAPPWARLRPRPGRLVVRIDPGLAFGTGSHATTRLCLLDLISLSRSSPLGDVLDVGTGSGVLAFTAWRLGARSVLGIEPDRDALSAARDNRVLNQIRSPRLRLSGHSAGTVRGRFDLVLANLVRDLLLDEADNLYRRVRPGGYLVASGILDDQIEAVSNRFATVGLRLAKTRRRQGWAALRFVR